MILFSGRLLLSLQLKIACVNLVAECNLSFNIAQSNSFGELLRLTAGHEVIVPSTHDIMNTLNSQYDAMKSKLIEKIAEQKYICTTCDIWSSRAQAYFCMTVHFINSNFKRESYVLAFREMKYKQTNKEITEIIRKAFREYEIDPDKVTHIITDGGSAFCKAFRIYGKSVDTLVEAPQNVSDDADDDMDLLPFIEIDEAEPFYSNIIDLDRDEEFSSETNLQSNEEDEFSIENGESNEDGIEFSQNIEINENTEDDANEILNRNDMYETKPLPPHRRCLSHLLNLIGNDFERALEGRAKTCLMATLSKLQAIWVFPRKSSQAKTYSKDILGCSLLIPCATRWNSKYDAVCKIYTLGMDKINAYIDALKTNLKTASHLLKLTKEDWTMISIYLKVMKPVATSLDRLQGEKESSQGFILPSLLTMKHNVKALDGLVILKNCRDAMLGVIENRFSGHLIINYSNKELLLAAVSIPRFKTDFIEEDSDVAIAKEILLDEAKILQTENVNEIENVQIENETENDFFISFASKREIRRNSTDAVLEEEIKRYLNDSRKEHSMLHDYPNIKNIFYRHNTSLCASAAVERVFSQSNMIFTPRRNRLSAKKFEQILLYKTNRKQLLSNGINI